MAPIVVSFYTIDTPYEDLAQHLQRSCQRFDVPCCIEGVPSRQSWEINCAFKPIFLLQKWQHLRQPIIWIDVDAILVRSLNAFTFHGDFGVRVRDCSEEHPSKVATGTVFCGTSIQTGRILSHWARTCLDMLRDPLRTQEVWDQDALRKVLIKNGLLSSILHLPIELCKISGHPEDEKCCPDPIIVHHQASRLYKRWISHPEERIAGL